MRITAILILLIAKPVFAQQLSQATSGSIQPHDFAGTYEWDGRLQGSRIELTAEGRFQAWFWTDVGGSAEPIQGRWEFEGPPGLIRLFSDRLPRQSVFASEDATPNAYEIEVVNPEGNPVEGAEITVQCGAKEEEVETDSNGVVVWQKCVPQTIQIQFLGYFPVLYVSDPGRLDEAALRELEDYAGLLYLLHTGAPSKRICGSSSSRRASG